MWRLPSVQRDGAAVWTLRLAGAMQADNLQSSEDFAASQAPVTGGECDTLCVLDSDAVMRAAAPWMGFTREAPARPAFLDGDEQPDGCGGLSARAQERRGPWTVSLRFGWTLDVRSSSSAVVADGDALSNAVAGILTRLVPLAPAAAVTLPSVGTCVHTSHASDAGHAAMERLPHRPPAIALVPLHATIRLLRIAAVSALHVIVPPPAQPPSRRTRLMDYMRGAGGDAKQPQRSINGSMSPTGAQRRSTSLGSGDGAGPLVDNPLFRGQNGASGSGQGGRPLDANAAYMRAATKAAAAAEKLAAAKAAGRPLSPQGSGISSPVEPRSPPRSGVTSPTPAAASAFWRKKAASASAVVPGPTPAPAEAAKWRAEAAAKQRARSAGSADGYSPVLSPENSIAGDSESDMKTTAEIAQFWKKEAERSHVAQATPISPRTRTRSAPAEKT